MRKPLLTLLAVLVAVTAAPMAVAVLVVAVLTPAAAQTVPCAGEPTATVITLPATTGAGEGEGGVGFALPAAGAPRLASLTTPAAPIPVAVKALYVAAADRYHLPWTLLAGIGMEETRHGATHATSTAGARGLMQFMPATFAAYGVDGDGDGRAVITDDADSIASAANYLTASGVTKGQAGVRRALLAYNHADWYVNDVLFYAAAYGGGTVTGQALDCPPGTGDPALPALASGWVATVLAWAQARLGAPYVMGATGPTAWDCSSFTQAAYRQIGITLPRTAATQRDWLAAGNGTRVAPANARPGDLIFFDSYLGPNTIGHVELVLNPATHRAIGAQNSRIGVATVDYRRDMTTRHIFQIWRVANLSDHRTG